MKKYTAILLLTIIFAPSIALASWWNPFTWSFKNFFFHKQAPVEQIEKIQEVAPVAVLPQVSTTPELNDSQVPTLTVSSPPGIKMDSKETTVPKKKSDPIVVAPKAPVTPSFQPVTITPQKQTLTISSVTVSPEGSHTLIQWQTNIPTISKVFIDNSTVVNSESGLSTKHIARVNNLEADMMHHYEIEAIADPNTVKYQGSFTVADFYSLDLVASRDTALVGGSINITVNTTKNGKVSDIPVEVTAFDPSQNKTITDFEKMTNGGHRAYPYIVKSIGKNLLTFRIPSLGIEKSITVTGVASVPIQASAVSSANNTILTIYLKNTNPGNLYVGKIISGVNKSGLTLSVNCAVTKSSVSKSQTLFSTWSSNEISFANNFCQFSDHQEIVIRADTAKTSAGSFLFRLDGIGIVSETGETIPVEGDLFKQYNIVVE